MNAVEKCNMFNFNQEDDDLEKFMSVPKNLIAENQNLYEEIEENLPTDVGMDVMSLDIFETLIEHLLNKGKIRDAMLLTLHANWGLRNSDVASTRVFEVLKPDGTFRKKVCKSEQKTGKLRNLYINNACRVAIATYLRSNPEKQMLDYLVTAEGNHKKYETATVKLSDGNVHEYTCIAALTRMSEERIIKNNLLELEVALSNDKRCKDSEGLKLNTHSLRKLYAEELGNTAYRLKQEGKIALDMQITQLCMLDLNHSDEKCTLRYIKHFERQKEIICNEMNLGLRQWLNQAQYALSPAVLSACGELKEYFAASFITCHTLSKLFKFPIFCSQPSFNCFSRLSFFSPLSFFFEIAFMTPYVSDI